MNNSAITKSGKNRLSAKQSQSDINLPQQNNIKTNLSQNGITQNNQILRPVISLFKPFRQSPESIQCSSQKERLPAIKTIPLQQKSSKPLAYQAKRQEEYCEVSSFEKQNQIKNQTKNNNPIKQNNNILKPQLNDKQKKYSGNQFNLQVDSQNSLQKHIEGKTSISKLKIDSQKFKDQQLTFQNKITHNVQENDHSLDFGQGIEEIKMNDIRTIGQSKVQDQGINNSYPNKIVKSFQRISSQLSPPPSNLTDNRRFTTKISEEQMRTTGRNFFKRSGSLKSSHDYLKPQTNIPQSGYRLNSSINRSKQMEFQKNNVSNKSTSSTKEKNSLMNSYQNLIVPTIEDSYSAIKRESLCLSFANNLTRLLFKYNGGHASTLYNYQLRIKNESAVRLSVKLKCTSPRHYEVRPCYQATLDPSQIFSVSIQIKLFLHDLSPTTMKHELSRYRSDKFKVIYKTVDGHIANQYFEGQRIFPVVIQQTTEERLRNEGLAKNLNSEKLKMATEQKEVQMYRKLMEKNGLKIEQINRKIARLQSQEFRLKYFSSNTFLLFGLIGTVIGFWFG